MPASHLLLIALAGTWAAISLGGTEPAADSSSNTEYDRLRATFQGELQKITDSDLADRLTIQGQYLKNLDRIEKEFQAAGQLEPLLAIRNERTRFEADRDITPTGMAAIHELKASQATFLRDRDALPLAQARRMVTLALQYDQSLEKLQTTLTKKGEVDAAIDVKKERDGLGYMPAIQNARAVVAEADAKARTEKPVMKPQTPMRPAPATPQPVKAAEKTLKKYSGKPEFYIRARFEKFCDTLLDQDWDKATAFADPVFIKRRGVDGVIMRLRLLFPFLQAIARLPQVKIKGGDVKFDPSGKAAMLTPKIWQNNQWRELPSQRWVEVDGDWYIEIEPVR